MNLLRNRRNLQFPTNGMGKLNIHRASQKRAEWMKRTEVAGMKKKWRLTCLEWKITARGKKKWQELKWWKERAKKVVAYRVEGEEGESEDLPII